MAATDVDAYLAVLADERREALSALRALIYETVPQVTEAITYNMPTFAVGDTPLCAMASQKRYLSLYLDVERLDAHRAAFAGLDVGKSCVRFRRFEQLPLDAVRQVLRETAAAQRPA